MLLCDGSPLGKMILLACLWIKILDEVYIYRSSCYIRLKKIQQIKTIMYSFISFRTTSHGRLRSPEPIGGGNSTPSRGYDFAYRLNCQASVSLLTLSRWKRGIIRRGLFRMRRSVIAMKMFSACQRCGKQNRASNSCCQMSRLQIWNNWAVQQESMSTLERKTICLFLFFLEYIENQFKARLWRRIPLASVPKKTMLWSKASLELGSFFI